MPTIFERVDDALTTLSPVPYAMKPYLTADGSTLPDTFIDFQLINGSAEIHADDIEKERAYTVQVTIWNVNGLINLPNVDGVMSTAGFMKGDVRQLPKDRETGHYGLATEYIYLETI